MVVKESKKNVNLRNLKRKIRPNKEKHRDSIFAAMLRVGSLGSEMSGQQNKLAEAGIPPPSKRQTVKAMRISPWHSWSGIDWNLRKPECGATNASSCLCGANASAPKMCIRLLIARKLDWKIAKRSQPVSTAIGKEIDHGNWADAKANHFEQAAGHGILWRPVLKPLAVWSRLVNSIWLFGQVPRWRTHSIKINVAM